MNMIFTEKQKNQVYHSTRYLNLTNEQKEKLARITTTNKLDTETIHELVGWCYFLAERRDSDWISMAEKNQMQAMLETFINQFQENMCVSCKKAMSENSLGNFCADCHTSGGERSTQTLLNGYRKYE